MDTNISYVFSALLSLLSLCANANKYEEESDTEQLNKIDKNHVRHKEKLFLVSL